MVTASLPIGCASHPALCGWMPSDRGCSHSVVGSYFTGAREP